jgi:hypothetical protein
MILTGYSGWPMLCFQTVQSALKEEVRPNYYFFHLDL